MSAQQDDVTEDRLLGGRIIVRQPRAGFRVAIDTVLLAAAVPAEDGQTVFEPGAGIGAAALCLAQRVPGCRVVGLEVQADLVRLAGQNVRLNAMERRIDVMVGEIAHPPPRLVPGAYDHVMMNPPFLEAGRAQPPDAAALAGARIEGDATLARKIAARKKVIAAKHDKQWAKWQDDAREGWDNAPMTEARMAHEIWDVIKDEDWVLTAGTLKDWVQKVWDFDEPYRHPGRELGTGSQIGMSIGTALAHRGSGRLVVDLQPDGDLMFDLGALWVPVKYDIPMLVVMYNNRAYYNDWAHQIHMAHKRGTDVARASIGMDLEGPEPDFAPIAQGLGWYAEGPIAEPGDVAPAVRRAIQRVKAGTPALVDVICWRRGENA